nr:transglutaminase family protein [uncultured Agathobaculum sp.]
MKPSIRIGANRIDGRRSTSAFELLFLIAGVCGLLSALHDLPGITWNAPAVYLSAVVMCAALWYTYMLGKGWFTAAFLLVIAVCGLVEYRYWDLLGMQIEAVIYGLTGESAGLPVDITSALLVLAALLILLLFLCEIWLRSSMILLSLTILLMICGPLVGLRPGYATVFLLATALCAFTAERVAGHRRKTVLLGSGHAGRVGKRTAAVCLAALLAFGAAVPLSMWSGDKIYQAVYATEGEVQRAMRQIAGTDAIFISDGLISRGNRHATGAVQMELIVNRSPTQPIYLRGFTGADYLGGEWTPADIQVLSNQIYMNLMRGLGGWSVSGINYHNLFFILNLSSGGENPYFLTILPRAETNLTSYYEPYYSRWSDNWMAQDGYSFQYFEPNQMNINWDLLNDQSRWLQLITQRIQEAYMSAAQTLYTGVPVDRLPQLTALCAENPHQSIEEVTAFIINTLHNRVRYSTTPGLAPLNEDIVEYSLFENGEGYCVHFAAAATLMYRLYGIPARYVSGYIIQPDAFVPQGDGTYRALVTDVSAHAWTELFIEERGWTPVEVTPSSAEEQDMPSGNGNAAAPAMLTGTDASQPTEGQLDGGADTMQREEMPSETPVEQQSHTERHLLQKEILFIGALVVMVVVLLISFVVFQRRYRLHRMQRKECRAQFERLLHMLSDAQVLRGCTGHEPDFAARLCTAVPTVRQVDAQRLVLIVSRSAFSESPASAEDNRFVMQLYFRVAEEIYCKLGPARRWFFRYIKVYC